MSWQRSVQAAIRALRRDEGTLKRDLAAVQRKIEELSALARGDAAA